MLGKVAKNVGLAPWEQDYQEQKRETERTLFSRSQWRAKGRMVIVGDEKARKSVVARSNGNVLLLYSEDQTRRRTEVELERDAWLG